MMRDRQGRLISLTKIKHEASNAEDDEPDRSQSPLLDALVAGFRQGRFAKVTDYRTNNGARSTWRPSPSRGSFRQPFGRQGMGPRTRLAAHFGPTQELLSLVASSPRRCLSNNATTAISTSTVIGRPVCIFSRYS